MRISGCLRMTGSDDDDFGNATYMYVGCQDKGTGLWSLGLA